VDRPGEKEEEKTDFSTEKEKVGIFGFFSQN
jgi:hypothetical protein